MWVSTVLFRLGLQKYFGDNPSFGTHRALVGSIKMRNSGERFKTWNGRNLRGCGKRRKVKQEGWIDDRLHCPAPSSSAHNCCRRFIFDVWFFLIFFAASALRLNMSLFSFSFTLHIPLQRQPMLKNLLANHKIVQAIVENICYVSIANSKLSAA